MGIYLTTLNISLWNKKNNHIIPSFQEYKGDAYRKLKYSRRNLLQQFKRHIIKYWIQISDRKSKLIRNFGVLWLRPYLFMVLYPGVLFLCSMEIIYLEKFSYGSCDSTLTELFKSLWFPLLESAFPLDELCIRNARKLSAQKMYRWSFWMRNVTPFNTKQWLAASS